MVKNEKNKIIDFFKLHIEYEKTQKKVSFSFFLQKKKDIKKYFKKKKKKKKEKKIQAHMN
jgi:hypothetical protein